MLLSGNRAESDFCFPLSLQGALSGFRGLLHTADNHFVVSFKPDIQKLVSFKVSDFTNQKTREFLQNR